MKKFAIPGVWSIVVDARECDIKTCKVIKKGKKMQTPVQSLNKAHQKKFDFPFDHNTFKYDLNS